MSHFDPRTAGYLPPIRLQQCDNCWAYATIGILEVSYIRNHPIPDPSTIALSAQQLVDCSGAGNCATGKPHLALQYLQSNFVATAAAYPDTGHQGACRLPSSTVAGAPPLAAGIHALSWGPADVDAGITGIALIPSIKTAIAQYGAVTSQVCSAGGFGSFFLDVQTKDSVFHGIPSDPANTCHDHVIMIVGWDDAKNAWLVRNSTGRKWGYLGYAWVSYDTNNIGTGALWVNSN